MTPIPPKIREQAAADPFYLLCCRRLDGGCSGRITWEHALIYAGRQVQEIFAIIPLCWFHHLGPGLWKEKNEAVALARATETDLAKYPKSDWAQKRRYLFTKHKKFLQCRGFKL